MLSNHRKFPKFHISEMEDTLKEWHEFIEFTAEDKEELKRRYVPVINHEYLKDFFQKAEKISNSFKESTDGL